MEKLFKIGDVAQLLDLTPQAIRYYEQQGVITPFKSGNGTRYYRAYDVHRLLAFRKYRTVDFSVQDIIDYMRSRDMAERVPWLQKKSGELSRLSDTIRRRAQALDYYSHQIRRALASVGTYTPCMRPATVVQKIRWEDMDELSEQELSDVRAYLDAMPVTNLGFITSDVRLKTPSYQLLCELDQALQWELPLKNTERLIPAPCIATCMVCPSDFEIQPALEQAFRTVRGMGHEPDAAQPIACILITADTTVVPHRTYIRCYIPIRTEALPEPLD